MIQLNVQSDLAVTLGEKLLIDALRPLHRHGNVLYNMGHVGDLRQSYHAAASQPSNFMTSPTNLENHAVELESVASPAEVR